MAADKIGLSPKRLEAIKKTTAVSPASTAVDDVCPWESVDAPLPPAVINPPAAAIVPDDVVCPWEVQSTPQPGGSAVVVVKEQETVDKLLAAGVVQVSSSASSASSSQPADNKKIADICPWEDE